MGTTQQHHGLTMLHTAGTARIPVCPAALLSFGSIRSGPRTTALSRHHGHSRGRQSSILPSSPKPPALHSLDLLLLPRNSYQGKCKPRIKQEFYWVSAPDLKFGWSPLRNHGLWGPWLNSGLMEVDSAGPMPGPSRILSPSLRNTGSEPDC